MNGPPRLDCIDEVRDHVVPDLLRTNASPVGDVLGGEGCLIGVMEALAAEAPKIPTCASLSIDGDELHADTLRERARSAIGIEATALRLLAASHAIRASWRRGVSLDGDILSAFCDELMALTVCLVQTRSDKHAAARAGLKEGNRAKQIAAAEDAKRIRKMAARAKRVAKEEDSDWRDELRYAWKHLHPDRPVPSNAKIYRALGSSFSHRTV
jgi:hypothetical protein